MGNIRDLLNKIRYATYGKEVRQSIHDAIEECYTTASVDHDNANMEVKIARGTHNTLNERFDSVEENIKNNSEQLEHIVQDENIVVRVGVGEKYITINEAISFLSRKKLKYDNSGFNAEILLKSGFVITEQIYVKDIDLGFITISSEDEIVKCDASSFVTNLNEEPYGDSGYPLTSASLFTGYGNAVMPTINILVDFEKTHSTQSNTNGLTLVYGAIGRIARDKGFINSGGGGVSILEGSRLYATDTIIKNSTNNNISCFRGSYILFRAGIATGSGEYGAYLDNACIMDCISANFSDNAESGIWAGGQSIVSANRMIANNCGRHGISADNCSIIDAHYSTINSSTQHGVSCDNSRISVNKATINNSGNNAINVTNCGIVDAKESDLSGSLGTNNVYANYGGMCNVSKAKVQKVEGVNDADLRVGTGGIIYAHGITGAGISGAKANQISNNGIVFTSDSAGDITSFGEDKELTLTSTNWSGTLTYSKMDNGIVWLRGTITSDDDLTPGTRIATIESGYRPRFVTPIQSIHSNNNTQYGLHISTSGGVFLSDTFVSGSYNINVLIHN